jgi:hypothetical protein
MDAIRSSDKHFPLSPVQQGLYFHHLLRRSKVYLEQMLCDVAGPLDVGLVERTVDKLVDLHECLRTVIVDRRNEGPRQAVLRRRRRSITYRDLSGTPGAREALARHVAEELQKNFDLAAETSRCELLRLGDDQHVLLWTYHHLIMDAWTLRLLQEQFSRIYLSASGRASPEQLEAYPYRLYVEWLQAQDERRARRYWSDYLAGTSGRAEGTLPTEDVDEHTVAVRVDFEPGARRSLGELARRSRSTVNSVLLAAWGLYVLDRFQRSDATIGCVVSGRMIPLRHVDKIGGLFVNTVPVRIKDADTVAGTISRIQRHLLLSAEHSYLSLSDITACGEATPASILSVINFSIDHTVLDGRYARQLPFQVRNIRYNEQAHYDVYVDVYVTERDLAIVIHHDARRHCFDAAETRRALTRILQEFSATPEAALGDVAVRIMSEGLSASGALHFGPAGERA